MSQNIVEVSRDYDRSKGFLLGLYVGLSLLLLVARFDGNHSSHLHYATNIYGVQALAGAVLGFWRIWKRADNPKTLPALASLSICVGLATWVIGQALWTWANFTRGEDAPYPGLSDIFYIPSNVFWLLALLMVFKKLDRKPLPAISPVVQVLISFVLSLLLTGLPTWAAAQFNPSQYSFGTIGTDFVYVLLTSSSALLAIALLFGDNTKIPYPINQCIRYLAGASVIDAVGILAFTVTTKIPTVSAWSAWRYYNGNWVDWLFLTAMFFWGVSALKWPVRGEELEYTFPTLSRVPVEDIYRASDIARHYYQSSPLFDPDTAKWILDNIPGCCRVIKLGQQVVGSTLLLPVPQHLMDAFRKAKLKENQTNELKMLEEAKRMEIELFVKVKEELETNPPAWDCLYLVDASILTRHRRRGLALAGFSATIENIKAGRHESQIEVHCWPITPQRTKLADKFRKHFDKQGIPVIYKD